MYIIRVVTQGALTNIEMLSMDRNKVLVIADFKDKWPTESYSEPKAEIRKYIHGVAILRLKENLLWKMQAKI